MASKETVSPPRPNLITNGVMECTEANGVIYYILPPSTHKVEGGTCKRIIRYLILGTGAIILEIADWLDNQESPELKFHQTKEVGFGGIFEQKDPITQNITYSLLIFPYPKPVPTFSLPRQVKKQIPNPPAFD